MLRTYGASMQDDLGKVFLAPKFEQVKWANRSCSGPIGCRATGCFLAFEHVIRKPWLTATVTQHITGQLNCSKPRCSIPTNIWLVFFRSAESSLPIEPLEPCRLAELPFVPGCMGALGATWVHNPGLRWSNRIKPQGF